MEQKLSSHKGYVISWDNPKNYDKILEALDEIGLLRSLAAKTSVLFNRYEGVTRKQLKKTIRSHLRRADGKAFLVSLKTGRTATIDATKNFKWKKLTNPY